MDVTPPSPLAAFWRPGASGNDSTASTSATFSHLGLSDTSSITPPSINIGDVLNTLGLNNNSSLGLGQILAHWACPKRLIAPNVGQILDAPGLSDSSNFGISQILTDLGIIR